MSITTPPLARRRRLVGVLAESTAGTLNDPSVAVATNFLEAAIQQDGHFPEPRQPLGNYFGTVDRQRGPMAGTGRLQWEMAHADELMVLILGCGFTVNTSNVATPSSNIAAHSTLSLKVWSDGMEKTLLGAAGTLTIEGTAGRPVLASMDLNGVWAADPTDEALPARAPITAAPFRARGMTATLGGVALPPLSTFTIALNCQLAPRLDISKSQAIAYYNVLDINPVVTLDTEARLVATLDTYGIFGAGTTAALQLVLTDGTNTLTIDAPRAQRVEVEDTDRDDKTVHALTLELHNSSGDDSISLTRSA